MDQVENPAPNPNLNPKMPPMGGDFKMPSIEEVLKALEGMDTLSEEDKQNIRDGLKTQAQMGAQAVKKGAVMTPDLIVLFGLLAFISLVFVFFGYKLYKSLSERERKKEEKKRQKQHKKKK